MQSVQDEDKRRTLESAVQKDGPLTAVSRDAPVTRRQRDALGATLDT